jgi:hypothetical protein
VSRIALTILSLGLVLGGSAYAQPTSYPAPPPGYPAPPPGYPAPPPGYPAPAPGYPAPPPGYPAAPPGTVYAAPGAPPPVAPGQPYTGPDGLTYVNGSPVYFAGGAYLPLVFVAGLGWGYYGYGHRWFGAPGELRVRLDHFYPGGRGFPGRFGDHGFHGDRGFHDNRDHR